MNAHRPCHKGGIIKPNSTYAIIAHLNRTKRTTLIFCVLFLQKPLAGLAHTVLRIAPADTVRNLPPGQPFTNRRDRIMRICASSTFSIKRFSRFNS